MTSADYRAITIRVSASGGRVNHEEHPVIGSYTWFLREIAAQLADVNEWLQAIAEKDS